MFSLKDLFLPRRTIFFATALVVPLVILGAILIAVVSWLACGMLIQIVPWYANKLISEQKYGYINREGKFVIPPQFYNAEYFKKGKALVYIRKSGRFESPCNAIYSFYINTSGKRVSEPTFVRNYCYSSGSANLAEPNQGREDADIDIIPKSGEPQYSDQNGYVTKRGYIKKSNPDKWVILPKYNNAKLFSHGVAWVGIEKGDWKKDQSVTYWGLINKKGEYVLSPKCNLAGNFVDGLALCRVNVYFGMFY